MSELEAAPPSDPPAFPEPSPYAAFAFREFRLFQAARFFTTVGTQMQSVAIGWQVYEIRHEPLDLGMVGLAQFVPMMVLSLVTGHVADRFDRRKVLVACQAALATASLLLMGLAMSGIRHPAPILLVLVLLGSARAFSGPVNQALLPHVVPKPYFANAVSWASSIWQVATILGPGLGGVVYGFRGPVAVYASSATLIVLSLAMLLGLRIRSVGGASKATSLDDVLAGVRYVWRAKVTLGAISLDLFAVLFGGAVALLPIFAKDVLHAGPWALGLLRSAPSMGAVGTAIFLAYVPIRRNAGRVMLVSVFVFGLATILFGLSKNVALSAFALVVVGASDMVSVWVRKMLLNVTTPDAMRGRVSAVDLVFVGASNELGEFESGTTAAWLGAVPAVVVGGIGTLVVVLVYAVLFPKLRRVDRVDVPADDGTIA
ncbi:MAG: MFS transporter [Polyangiaceae bacterium]